MYPARRIFALMLCVDLPLATAAEAQSDSPPAARATSTATNPPLLADCIEKRLLTSSPPERKASPRPKRHLRHGIAKKIVHKKAAHPRRHAAARPKRTRHALHRRPAPPQQHVILHRVLYASPLCDKRSSFINELIGLPDNEYEVTQIPVAYVTPDVIDVATVLPPIIPYTPIYPPGPGPIILPPVGPGPPPLVFPRVTPPVTPPVGPPITLPVTTTPVITIPVPEPASWMTMLFGFALVGGLARRRRKASPRKA
jgi:hypothetical protein